MFRLQYLASIWSHIPSLGCNCISTQGASQVALVVKNLPISEGDTETCVLSLGREDPLEEGAATHSSILAWRIP